MELDVLKHIAILAVALLATGCALVYPKATLPYRACHTAKRDGWRALPKPPEQAAQLLAIAGNPQASDNWSLYWFDKPDGNILLCQGDSAKRQYTAMMGCWDHTWKFADGAGGWQLAPDGEVSRICLTDLDSGAIDRRGWREKSEVPVTLKLSMRDDTGAVF